MMFEELDYRRTPLGELVLRRRREAQLGGCEVYEVKLGEAFLMSSLFTAGETALAELGLADLADEPLDVVVGGLGLGYTAAAALRHPALRSLLVIEALQAVIDWHRQGLVPLGSTLAADVRCRLDCADFFALAATPALGFDRQRPGRRFHAVLLDVDHSPRHHLHASHASLYTPAGLRLVGAHLHPGGAFALWSNDPPDAAFQSALADAFAAVRTQVVRFDNPYTGEEAACTIYASRTGV